MTSDRFARVKALLLGANELSSAERAAYLDAECGDDADLRAEVENILDHESDADGILKIGAVDPAVVAAEAATVEPSTTRTPQEIAGYRIVRKLGEGGMGVVYEAEQRSPRRAVALKVIRGGGYVDERRIRLFQREAQVLARLKHPGIAAIYESGGTETGQHFFAMELVRGVPLDEYLHKHPLDGSRAKDTIRQRLDLFLQICAAISYAHQRGVIHRDLKPGNILVTSGASGSRPGSGTDHSQVKILDFGLARMTDADVAMTTMVTEAGSIQGTLAYMSPEQARGNPDEIDIRSDVYSLGVLFYELLTGALPYDVRRTMIHEAVRMICEQEPARPSTIRRTLRGDLETIALKALEKEPARRYQSAAALAEDIDRYLIDQPILARPPSATYQFRKLVARHRTAFAFVAMMMLALSVGLVLVTVQNTRIAAARDEAELVTTTLEEMLASVDPTKSGRDVTVREMLDETAKTLGVKFKDQPLVEARLRCTVGETYNALGEFDAAEEHLREAVEIRREHLGEEDLATLEAELDLAWVSIRLGSHKEAEALARDTLEISRRVLGGEHPQTLTAMHVLGVSLGMQGRAAEAEPLYREALEISRRVLGDEHPQTLRPMHGLGLWCAKFGSLEEGEALLQEVLDTERRLLGEEHPYTLLTGINIGFCYRKQGRYEEAEAFARKDLEISRRVLGDEHLTTLCHMFNLADAYDNQGRYEEAEALWREHLETMRRVFGEEHPRTLTATKSFAHTYVLQGRYDEAETLLRTTLEISRRVRGERHPDTNGLRYDLACDLALQDRRSDAISSLRDALDHGYRGPSNWSWIREDPDLAALHNDPEFEAIAEELKRRNEEEATSRQTPGAE